MNNSVLQKKLTKDIKQPANVMKLNNSIRLNSATNILKTNKEQKTKKQNLFKQSLLNLKNAYLKAKNAFMNPSPN